MTDKQPKALQLAELLDASAILEPADELRRLHAENEQLRADLEAVGAGGVGPLMPSKLTQHDIADSGLLGNIEIPFNACMHQEHCKRWKKQAGHSPDAGNMVTPDEIDYAHELRRHSRKLCEPVGETAGVMQRAADEIEQLRAMLAAAPQPPVVEQPPVERAQQVAARKDAVFEASIDFIGTLTGMRPPPIETAPPEIFKPFRDFTEKVCSIFSGAPLTSKPLTDEQIDSIADAMPGGLEGFMKGWGWRQFARAIERAHGIGDEA